MEKHTPDLANLPEKSQIEADVFPQFYFRQTSILQWKKCFIEKFWSSTTQLTMCKITIQFCASFKLSICSQRVDVPEEREAKFKQALPKHSHLGFLRDSGQSIMSVTRGKNWGKSSL